MRAKPGTVTIYDVADRAGVSISTVSLVVNAPHRVRPETRERVVTAAMDLGYRMTAGRRVGAVRIAVAAPFTAHPSYLRRLAGMLTRARTAAVDVIPYDLDSAASAPSPLLETLPVRGDVSGLVLMGVPLGGAARRASRAVRIPVVHVDVVPRGNARLDGPVVLVDDHDGGAQLGAHLAARGHRRFGFVHDVQRSPSYTSSGMLRAQGLAEHGTVIGFPVGATSEVADAVRRAAEQGCSAIVAGHDQLAAEALAVTRADPRLSALAVVGYDDGDLARALDLTTVRQPLEETGRTALELLLAIVSTGEGSAEVVRLRPALVVRGSSSAASRSPRPGNLAE